MKVSVFGLGYVGCVSAACLAKEGHEVVGVDINPAKVEAINRGKSPIIEAGVGELIARMVADKRLWATTDSVEAINKSEISIVCVGTPSNGNGSLDLTYIRHACRDIAAGLESKRKYHIVVIRSTMLPGTMEDVIVRALEVYSGRKSGNFAYV
jgi:GDP-mannose 6-dehydrogenase